MPITHDIDSLLHGAIDMHVHSYPDVSYKHPGRRSNHKVIDQCREAGMGGIVLKTHCWPVVTLAQELDSQYDDFSVISSVSLNQTVGGPYPWAVEMAYQMGCKYIWLPTWSARADRYHDGFYEIMKGYNKYFAEVPDEAYYTIIDESGELTENVKECLNLCKEYDLVCGTGHVSTKESLACAKYAHQIGYKKLCFTHPRANIDKFTMDDLCQFVEYGGYIEHVVQFLHPINTTTTIDEMMQMINETGGPENSYLSTDYFWDAVPSIPAQLDEVLATMYSKGASFDFLKTLISTPNRILEM